MFKSVLGIDISYARLFAPAYRVLPESNLFGRIKPILTKFALLDLTPQAIEQVDTHLLEEIDQVNGTPIL
jgi:hypothetical protein